MRGVDRFLPVIEERRKNNAADFNFPPQLQLSLAMAGMYCAEERVGKKRKEKKRKRN